MVEPQNQSGRFGKEKKNIIPMPELKIKSKYCTITYFNIYISNVRQEDKGMT
jgi:hypothetical protein